MMKSPRAALALVLAVLLGLLLSRSALRGQEKDSRLYVNDFTRQGRTRTVRWKIPSLDTRETILSPEVVADKDSSLHLAHSVLLADETGSTDYRQTESLNERAQAKKVFSLDDIDVDSAELFFFGTAKQVQVNGHLLKVEPLVSTGWKRAHLSPVMLKTGANELIFSGGGNLLIEPGRPGNSFRSDDSGETWSNRALGGDKHLQGEYLVRVRLPRYAPHGWAISPVFDLWITESGLGQSWKIEQFGAMTDLNKGQPEGAHLTAWLRTGSTPTPDVRNWTAWRELDRDVRTDAKTSGHRWAQLKFDFATMRAQITPRLRAIELNLSGTPPQEHSAKEGTIEFISPSKAKTGTGPAIGSVPFVYQQPSPRLKLLREKHQLDKVIAAGKTEMEQLMLLRYWVRNQCHRGWASHPALWIPPWDALLILESRDRPDCLVMCTHFSCIFTQCCLALGWNARHCILDHHCVSEVWVDQHRKWVMVDTGNSAERADVGLHFERGGVPLSARELHLLYRGGKIEGVQVCFTPERLMKQIAPLCRPAPPPKGKPLARPDTIPLAELKKYPVCQLENYRRYAFPPRNNYLTSLYPGELEHGYSNYFYDGYCWVGDSPDDPHLSPEYSRHLSPKRPQDIDWDVNWVRLHLSRTAKAGEVQVDVETHVPNLARLEKIIFADEKEKKAAWQTAKPRFVWKLKPGTNVLEVRGVNRWERAGQASRVAVEWKPAK